MIKTGETPFFFTCIILTIFNILFHNKIDILILIKNIVIFIFKHTVEVVPAEQFGLCNIKNDIISTVVFMLFLSRRVLLC